MPVSTLHLSPPAGRSFSLQFPLLLLLLLPSPVLAADPREPPPGRRPPSLCPGEPRILRPWQGPLSLLSCPLAKLPLSVRGAWEGGGSLVCWWGGGSLKTPGECGLG